jgi:hypothetical protein
MIQRLPEAIIQAAKMDPSRRDLFVEGIQDKLILDFLSADSRNRNVRILVIDHVADIPLSEGGAKGRLLQLAQIAANSGLANLRFFIDHDCDKYLGREYPQNVWHTDYPDMEGYVIRRSNIDKVLKIAYLAENILPSQLLEVCSGICRKLFVLRLLSERESLRLPITSSRKSKFIRIKNGQISFAFENLLKALLQEAGISLTLLTQIMEKHDTLSQELASVSDTDLIRGKDFLAICEVVLSRWGINNKELPQVLWATLESDSVMDEENLRRAVEFLSA